MVITTLLFSAPHMFVLFEVHMSLEFAFCNHYCNHYLSGSAYYKLGVMVVITFDVAFTLSCLTSKLMLHVDYMQREIV